MNDYTIRLWRTEDRPQLKALWQTAFGDSDKYIESFFSRFLKPGACVAADMGGAVVSAMYILPGQTLYPHRKNMLSASYVYALATLPEHRGRGIGTAVYRAASDAALQNADAACVLPAEAELYPFYEKAAGAKPVSHIREARFTKAELAGAEPCKSARIPLFEYAAMRESFLSGMPHAALPLEFLEMTEDGGADFLVLENGLAAAETDGGVCRIRELIVPDGAGISAVAAVARWFRAEEYIVRSPVFFDGPGQTRPFMLAVLKQEPSYPMPDDLWWGFGLE